MTAKPLLPFLILFALCGPTWHQARSAEGEVGAVDNAGRPLRFVRVFVPTDQVRLEDCTDKSIKYWPVDPQEFEQLLATAQTTGRADRAPGAAIVSARYEARLDVDTLVEGDGRLDIVHAAEGPLMLPLDPCGLAIRQASWAGQPGQDAQIGLGPDGKLAVAVERAGRLQLGWSLRGRRDPAGTVHFQWQAPPSPSSCLVLRLPAGMTPMAEQAVVAEEGPEGEAIRRWRIELGGHRRLAIRVVPTHDSLQRLPSTGVRQSTVYGCTLRGLDVRVDLELDVYGEPLEQVNLELDPGLRPVKALYGETPLEWTWTSPASGAGVTHWGLELPEPIHGPARIVRLQLLAPIELDHRWELPSVRPQRVFWEEGEATLSVSPPLRLEELVPIKGRQRSKIEPLPAPRSGETVRVQCFAPDAGVQIVLTRPEAPLQLDGGTTVEFSGGEVAGRVGVTASVKHGERFQIEADVAPDWVIDSVEAVPAEILADWSVADDDSVEAAPAEILADRSVPDDQAGTRLSIQLAKPLPPPAAEAPPVRLRIAARRVQSALGRPLGIDELMPLRFRGAVQKRRLFCLRAREPYELRLTGEETLTRVDPQSLPPDTLALLAPQPGSVLFEQDAGAAGLRVSLRARKPSYSSTIRVEATVSDHSLTESYWLECVPEAGRRVDRVLVRFSCLRPDPLRWTLGSEDSDHWTVRRLSPARNSAGGGASEAETWEIRLHPPRSAPFELRATRTTPLTEQEAVSLAAIPQAKQQQATVAVRSSGSAAVEIETDRLKPTPAAAVPADQYSLVRGTFRYDPVQDVEATTEPALAISRLKAEDVQPSAWAWSCRLESQYEPSGTGRHLATYRLESAGGERVRLTLPPAATRRDMRGIWIDNEPVRCRPAGTDADGALDISLPPGKRFAVLSICFATAGRPLGVVDSIIPPLPQIDVPVLSREWTVWLPPDYRADDERLAGQARGRSAGWAQRLFGPLGRNSASAPFDPFSLQDWRRVISGEPSRRPAESQAAALVRWLGERTGQRRLPQETVSLDWGTLLGEGSMQRLPAGAGNRRVGLVLLVDRPALARSGLSPAAPVRLPVGETPAGRGSRLLQQQNLTLLVHPDALVVTTDADAALRRAQLTPVENYQTTSLESQRLWWVRPGPLSDRIGRAAAGQADDTLVPVRRWQQHPPQPPLPWNDTRSKGFEPIDARGWTAYRLRIPHQSPLRLSVVHRDTLRAFCWIAFLAVIGLAWWTAVRRPATLIAALGVFGTAALLLPETYAPIGAGAVLGTLFVVGVWLIRLNGKPGGSSDGSPPRSESSSLRKATTALGILLWAQTTLLVLGGSARGGEPKPAPLPARSPVYPVLIPVDDQMQPTGEKCQVPLDFYNQLRRLAGAATTDWQGWVLGPATYRGKLVWEPASDRLVLSELKATFDLEVLSPSARVVIPFGESGPDLSPDGVLLDGQPIQYQLGKNALEFEVSARGPDHRLELSFRPATRTDEAFWGVDLAIPRLATSRLELTVPPDAPAIEVLSAVGSTAFERGPDSSRVAAELGPADRLSIRWERDASTGGAGRTVDVEELLWLKVEPESVVLNARYMLDVVEGPVGQLRLTADPRLRLRPMEGVEMDSTPGLPQTIRLELSEPVADRKTVEATFFLPEASGIGNVRMPHLEVVGVRSTRRWMAVSVHPSLEAEAHVPDAMETVAVPDFVAAWGAVAGQPRWAYRLASGEPPWSMTTRPVEPEMTVDQTQAWTFASGEAEVQFEARLAATGGYRFQHRLSAPPALEIESASVLEGGAERVDRWRAAPDGTVTVFLKRGTAGEQELSLRGRLPIPERGKLRLPAVRMDGANVQSSLIQIFRKPEVLVNVNKKTSGLVEDEQPLIDADRASLGRLVKSFHQQDAGPIAGTVTVSPNRPQVRGEQVTRLRADGDAWEAEVAFHLVVDRGVLDEIRLGMPAPCLGPFGIDPPATWEEEEAAGRRRLVLRPDSAITGEYRFTVTSLLDFAPGEPVSVPELTIAQVDVQRHLLVLPTQAGLRPVVWQTHGVRRAELPDDFAVPPVGREALAVYQVEEEPFGAILRPVSGEPAVHLADVRLAWQADGTCRGLAVLDLEPAGMSACSLRLPAGCQLVQVAAAGTASVAVRTGQHRWRVPLNGTTFPQQIEVLYQATVPLPEATGVVRFESPVLEGLPARQTLWTVTGPPDYGQGRPEGPRSVSPLEQELVRLENTESLVQLGAQVTPETAEEMDGWYGRWIRRWAASCQEVELRRLRSGPIDSAAMAQADRLPWDRLPVQVAQRLRRADLPGTISAERPAAAGLAQLWLRTVDPASSASRCVDEQGSTSITLRYRRLEGKGLVHRWVGAAGWAALALLTLLGLRWGLFAPWAGHWPYLLGVIGGLAWWLWLWPSILGWGIVLASLAGSFRWGWRRPRPGGSAIVTLTLAKR